MSISFVYITAPDMAEAEAIARDLVEAKLAACVNVFENMTSFYMWEGEMENNSEVVLMAKTRAGLVNELTKRVKAMHSYDVPCVAALDAVDGNKEFFSWIRSETKKPEIY